MSFSDDKKKLVQQIQTDLLQDNSIVAAWLGGSTATGFEDELSDTDLVLVCADAEHAFQKVESLLNRTFGIDRIWKSEPTLWPLMKQKFYTLKNTPETYYVDVCVFTTLEAESFREYFNEARHGRPSILFDKVGILQKASQYPKLETDKKLDRENEISRFTILYKTFLKESYRNKFIDAFLFYQRLILLYVQELRLKTTPQKHDFGLRYLYRDLPREEAQFIEEMLKVPDLKYMQENAQKILDRYNQLRSQ